MNPLLYVVYTLMAIWLLIASGRRIAGMLATGQDLDWSPFVSGGIGLIALVLLIPAWEQRNGR